MKKHLAFLLALLMALSLVSCGAGEKETDGEPAPPPEADGSDVSMDDTQEENDASDGKSDPPPATDGSGPAQTDDKTGDETENDETVTSVTHKGDWMYVLKCNDPKRRECAFLLLRQNTQVKTDRFCGPSFLLQARKIFPYPLYFRSVFDNIYCVYPFLVLRGTYDAFFFGAVGCDPRTCGVFAHFLLGTSGNLSEYIRYVGRQCHHRLQRAVAFGNLACGICCVLEGYFCPRSCLLYPL